MSAADTAAFLGWVHKHVLDADLDGCVAISHRNTDADNLKSRYTSAAFRLAELDAAADAADRISSASRSAFCRVHRLDRDLPSSSQRGKGSMTRWVTHLAADVDILGPGHVERNLPPDLEAAVAIIDATLAPSAIVSSGGGSIRSGDCPGWSRWSICRGSSARPAC